MFQIIVLVALGIVVVFCAVTAVVASEMHIGCNFYLIISKILKLTEKCI